MDISKENNKQMRKAIKDYLSGIPEMQISLGRFVKKIGYKYIYLYGYDFEGNFYETKQTIEDFFYSRNISK